MHYRSNTKIYRSNIVQKSTVVHLFISLLSHMPDTIVLHVLLLVDSKVVKYLNIKDLKIPNTICSSEYIFCTIRSAHCITINNALYLAVTITIRSLYCVKKVKVEVK